VKDWQYTLSTETTIEERDAIHEVLRKFNELTNPRWWKRFSDPDHQPLGLVILARDPEGELAAGLFGETEFSWCKIAVMGVAPPYRGQGIGKRMLELAEEEARRRDCRYVYVDTMDFQAPGFYEKAGYQVAGRLPDWDSHGHAKVFLVKTL